MNLKKLLTILISFFIIFSVQADEVKLKEKNTEFSIYTGMFDFSDDGKRSSLVGIQHQNEDLNRDTIFGNLSPITGAMITADNATYFYTGVQAHYKIGALNLTPSFAPGYYNEGGCSYFLGTCSGHCHQGLYNYGFGNATLWQSS